MTTSLASSSSPSSSASPSALLLYSLENHFLYNSCIRLGAYIQSNMQAFDCPTHDMEHIYRVASLAVNIYYKETLGSRQVNEICKGDIVCFLTAVFHDIFDSKLQNKDVLVIEMELIEVLRESFISSSQSCSIDLKAVLHSMDDNDITEIISNIRKVGYKHLIKETFDREDKALTLEYKCTQDADLLDAIGAIGVARAFTYGGKMKRMIYANDDNLTINISHAEYTKQHYVDNIKLNSVQHFFDKLLNIKGRVFTQTAKGLAEKRHKFLVIYLEELDAELKEGGGRDCDFLARKIKLVR